jgi:hypothetical protein
MGSSERIQVKRGVSLHRDAREAVHDLASQISQPALSGVVFFCSSTYDLPVIAEEFAAVFDCPVAGCTTSGEITPTGYREHSLTGVSIQSSELAMHPRLIKPLTGFTLQACKAVADEVRGRLTLARGFDPEHTFSLLLIDGMSMLEEQVVASLHHGFDRIPLVGGSAGDDLQFKATQVYHDGEFHDQAGVITIFETTLPFRIFKTQHFEPSNVKMVITEADPPRRVVTEINGGPAAEEYARSIGVELSELTPSVFSNYPVMLRIGGEYYVRSIQKMNADHSLSFYCAIDNGLVLTLARGIDLVENLDTQLAQLKADIPEVQLILGCDCILRRLEMFDRQIQDQVQAVLAKYNFIGFSTYGEQFNAVHVNQTLTGVAIGG